MSLWLSRAAAAAAVLLGLAGGYLALRPAPGPAATVELPGPDLGEVPVGVFVFEVAVTNPSGRPVTVLGVPFRCADNCCFCSERPNDVVAPGQRLLHRVALDVKGPGPFEAEILFYLNEDGLREIPIPIRGVGVTPVGP